jgi:hypothetical protein
MFRGILFNPEPEQFTKTPSNSHVHLSGHINSILAGRITNQNQNITTGVAISSDTNTTVSLDGMTGCCNLHRERNCS